MRAAIKTSTGGLFSLPAPCRHADVICEMQSDGVLQVGAVQGFVTEDWRFVDRTEAYTIAEAAGQLLPLAACPSRKPGTLYSEDLW